METSGGWLPGRRSARSSARNGQCSPRMSTDRHKYIRVNPQKSVVDFPLAIIHGSHTGETMAQPTMATIPALKENFAQIKTRMDKAVDDFRKEMAAVRTGRASVHMLDGVQVEAYGTQMKLNEV